MKDTIQSLKLALQNEKKAREQAEEILLHRTSELLEVREALQAKITEYDVFFENLLDSFIVMDTMGNVIKMNDAAVKLFGYDIKEEEFNVVNIIYREDFEYAMNSFAKLIENGSFPNYEARVYTKDKQVKWVQINSSLIYNEEGEIIAAQGVVRDITEAKENAADYEEQREQLATIVDNSTLGIVLAQDRKIIKTNKAFQKLVQYSEEELVGFPYEKLSFDESIGELRLLYDQMHNGEINQYSTKKKYKRKDGTSFLSKTNVTGVRDAQGKIKYQLALIEDVTEKYKRRLMLNTLNSLTRSFIGKLTIHDIAWEIANVTAHDLEFEDCVVYLVNKKTKLLEQIAGYGAQVDKNKEIINKIYIPFGKGLVGHVAQTGKAELINDTTKDKRYVVDDKRRSSEITVPIIVNGEVVGIIDSENSVKNFFTKEHLRLLKNVADLVSIQLTNAVNLERRIEAESQNEELLENLKRSNKELRDFAHIVSHDLKSPLRSINALVSWFQEDYEEVLDEGANETFEKLNNKLEQMDALIDGILRYSSVNDKSVLIVQKVKVKEILEEIQTILYIPEHIQFIFPEDLPIIKADKTRIKQLFQNLISNAIDYVDKEDGKIEVKFKELKYYWKFSVSDNGIGIAKAYHDKIFKIFQTLDTKGKSTGIGLSIVKKIIELYKGDIYLESEEGKGTTFFFKLKK
ncbi:Phytochrome-like protein cph1 [Kordia antarctica]|uniref:histidine kinase n=1 Tax=Kordia antarctica TaxID=1218801 RepID=A0A7L4ZNH0_9FLAO|nr:PAS domain S-box protein [Kordia antarctica]QHI38278.1 Phytochrome-like protein cph1 [Kordia antarctica]